MEIPDSIHTNLFLFSDWRSNPEPGTSGYGMEDYAVTHPEWGPVGAIGTFTWDQLSRGGQFRWEVIDNWAAKQKQYKTTTGDPRPVGVLFCTHLAESKSDGFPSFADKTPPWIYETGVEYTVWNNRRVGHVVTVNGKPATFPRYESYAWRYMLGQFVEEFGKRYDQDPNIDFIIFGPGIDGETDPTKPPYPVSQLAGVEYRFNQLCLDFPAWWRKAFPTKPLFYNNTPGQGRIMTTQACKEVDCGIHFAGMIPDINSAKGIGTYVGNWDHLQWAKENGVPIMGESATGLGDRAHIYWCLLMGLHFGFVTGDFHRPWFERADPAWLQFFRDHTNSPVDVAASSWVALRDTIYPTVTWGTATSSEAAPEGGIARIDPLVAVYERPFVLSEDGEAERLQVERAIGGCSGWPGDFSFFIRTLPEGRTVPVWASKPAGDPNGLPEGADRAFVGAASCRQVFRQAFEIDEDWDAPPYDLYITLLNQEGGNITLHHQDGDRLYADTIALGTRFGPINTWIDIVLPLGSRQFIIESLGGIYVHMLWVQPYDEPPDPPPDPTDYLPEYDPSNTDQANVKQMAIAARWWAEESTRHMQTAWESLKTVTAVEASVPALVEAKTALRRAVEIGLSLVKLSPESLAYRLERRVEELLKPK